MSVEFKHCNINFERLTEPYEKLVVNFIRPGKTIVTVDKEDFSNILNALMDVQQMLKLPAAVRSYYSDINPKYSQPEDPDIYLLATKVNQDVKISIIGFECNTQQTTKLFTIYIDQEDDIYKLCAEFLRFINQYGENFRARLYME